MTRKLLFLAIFFMCAYPAVFAQDYRVASVRGDVFRYTGGQAEKLSPRQLVSADDSVYIAEYSALNVVRDNKMYALKYSGSKVPLGSIIKDQKKSVIGRFASSLFNALMRGDTDKISHDANVVYKDSGADMQVYAALKTAERVSAYPLSMSLIDEETGEKLSGEISIGQRFYFRITNNASTPLYVNVLDADSAGGFYDCFPIDQGGTMLHLLVPAESVTDFRQYGMEFAEPSGVDRLMLVGYDRPFDLRNVIKALESDAPAPVLSDGIGFYQMNVIVK